MKVIGSQEGCDALGIGFADVRYFLGILGLENKTGCTYIIVIPL
jgi:hypothetical protein